MDAPSSSTRRSDRDWDYERDSRRDRDRDYESRRDYEVRDSRGEERRDRDYDSRRDRDHRRDGRDSRRDRDDGYRDAVSDRGSHHESRDHAVVAKDQVPADIPPLLQPPVPPPGPPIPPGPPYLQTQTGQEASNQPEELLQAQNHPLLHGDTVFSVQAKDEYMQRMAARTSDDMDVLKSAMKLAVKKEDFQEAGLLKRRMEKLLAENAAKKKAEAKASGAKKGSFMQKQLAKIKKVKETNEQLRQEEAQLESMDGAQGDYMRFMRDLEKSACHNNGSRGDDFFAISCNTHRVI